jgi:hypothetical protein
MWHLPAGRNACHHRDIATVCSHPFPREKITLCKPGYNFLVPSALVMTSFDGEMLNLKVVVAPADKVTLSKSTRRLSGTECAVPMVDRMAGERLPNTIRTSSPATVSVFFKLHWHAIAGDCGLPHAQL